MIASLSFIFLVGLSLSFLCRKIKLPRIIGMLVTGLLLGPFVLNLLDPTILGISSELQKIALIIILIKAGLSLNIADLKKIGRPAIRMSFVPTLFELGAELLLFVLVGAAVDNRYTRTAGLAAVALILLSLVFRSVGVYICLVGTNLNAKEKLYCVIAYLPKATVQAAIGSVPLSLGLPCGNMILSVAVPAILITAPLGAILMDATYAKLLKKPTDR